ncbi:tyrosine-type recombinase/integrase [Sporomusa acidovorans]|uniref:Tyrosine recombinase XerC n=1 Tax=Sporomusa acidovorans (strain ATCC 49682 / DSM 3132 / Mol) TaxID=1123286 RepID=A0ABZ3J527_SPOA4|nr:site-specific integrase [Sporomusa acidovorans]OZC23966.1 tyrosine recombinase XerD [Sporomusa acidovorans DSM 3132]SDF84747.1 Phage integrase family protein [Sporomusa acidovorans]
MKNKPPYEYISNYANMIKGFIAEKHLSGYRFTVQERWMKQLDRYCADLNIQAGELTVDILEGFCNRNPSESQMTRQQRLRMVCHFTEYLRKNGYNIGTPEAPVKVFSYSKRIPYIFTEAELKSLYNQIDNWETTPQSRGYRKQMDPVIFRMVYGCGLRIMEALRLRIADVDLKSNILYIFNSKNGRDRIVPMSESLSERCRLYWEKMRKFEEPNDYFLPGISNGNHISHENF